MFQVYSIFGALQQKDKKIEMFFRIVVGVGVVNRKITINRIEQIERRINLLIFQLQIV